MAVRFARMTIPAGWDSLDLSALGVCKRYRKNNGAAARPPRV
jgi:hypothetical protein